MRFALGAGLVAACLLACTGDVARPAPSEPAAGEPSASPRLRRLSAREYANTMRDLTGFVVDTRLFAEDTVVTGYDNGTVSLGVGIEQVGAYTRVAESAAARAVAESSRWLACDVARDGAAACRDAVLDGAFLRRTLRRPPTKDERAALRAVFDAALGLADAKIALQTMIEAIFQSPSFLYRAELGAAFDGHRVTLSAWERASALAYFLTGTTPDDALLDAAAAGALDTPEGMKREALRLVASTAGRVQLRHFLEQWLALDRIGIVVKDPKAHPAFGEELRASMREEEQRFLDEVLADHGGSLAGLFGSAVAFVDARMAELYGAPYRGPGFERVELDPGTRRGILTRAAYLAVHSGPDETGPVGRGLFVRSALLCATLPPPPPGIDRNVPKVATRTTRDRFAAHSASPACQGCHLAIDGAGFPFEEFDALGRHRRVENGVAVDRSGLLVDSDGADGAVDGVVDLEARLLTSPRLPACFVRQAFRFAMGSAETLGDDATLRALGRGFAVTSSIAGLMVDVAASRAFVERWAR